MTATFKVTLTTPEPAPRLRLLRTDATPLTLVLMGRDNPARAGAEAFIRTIFAQAYGAQLDTFYPVLLCIIRPDGDYAAVAGVRTAGEQMLFSEHYLDQPVEKFLGSERHRIAEVGNLAPASAGQARWLICTLTAFLAGAGFSDVVFTAVPRLRNAFSRMGLPLARLAEARPDNLPDKLAKDWGSYYENYPAVYSGDLRLGFHTFTRLIKNRPELRNILRQAYTAWTAFADNSVSGEMHEYNYPRT